MSFMPLCLFPEITYMPGQSYSNLNSLKLANHLLLDLIHLLNTVSCAAALSGQLAIN